MPAPRGVVQDRGAVVLAERIGAARKQERRHIDMQRRTGLVMAIDFDIDRMPEQRRRFRWCRSRRDAVRPCTLPQPPAYGAYPMRPLTPLGIPI